MDNKHVKLEESAAYKKKADKIFTEVKKQLLKDLPDVEIEHIGASSVDGLVSKGDLDILVVVEASEFEPTKLKLERLGYRPKEKGETLVTAELQPFDVTGYPIDVAIQLIASGSRFEFFRVFKKWLQRSEYYRDEYNRIKRENASAGDEAYKKAKSIFIEEVLRKDKNSKR